MPKHALPKTGPHGIDITAPGGIAALLAYHRAAFGTARMELPGEAGSGGEGGQSGEAGAGDGGQGGDGGQQDPPKPTPSASGQQQPPAPEKVEDLPDWAQKLIRDTRGEAASNRTKATEAEQRQQQTLDAIAKALGLKDDSEQPDPSKLTEQLTATQQTARQAKVDLAVYQHASHKDVQGDPAALLDSRSFQAKVADLDPTAEDFQTKVIEAMKAAVTDNPKLKAVRATGASSVDHAGGTGDTSRKPTTLNDAVSRHYGA